MKFDWIPNAVPTTVVAVLLWTWQGMAAPPGAASAETNSPVSAGTNGMVSGPPTAALASLAGKTGAPVVWYDFGMPAQAPERWWWEAPPTPLCHTQWEQNGIRYTQTVLVTRLGEGSPLRGGALAEDAVLLIKLLGENTATEYTAAQAAFEVRIAGRALDLVLSNDVACWAAQSAKTPLAVVDIPSGGVDSAKGTRLRFLGNMPPGTSGFMTIKIPAFALDTEARIEQVRNLEMADEIQRARKYWVPAGAPFRSGPVPLVFRDGAKD